MSRRRVPLMPRLRAARLARAAERDPRAAEELDRLESALMDGDLDDAGNPEPPDLGDVDRWDELDEEP